MHYRIEPLAEGIAAAIAETGGSAICNSGLVRLGGGELVFDTGLTVGSATELGAHARTVLGGPASLVVNSHWHLDHMLGNPAFPGVPVWATRRTREVVLEQRAALEAELRRAELERAIGELEGRRSSLPSETARADLEFVLTIYRALLSESGTQKLVAPDQTFETNVRLPGSREAMLRSFGRGHTEADAVLHLPSDGLLFAGDLVVSGIQPSLGSGDPEHWLVVLDELERLNVERIVPGHGPVLRPDRMEETRAYVGGVLKAAEAAVSAPLPKALERWEGSVSLEDNLRAVRSWLLERRRKR